ncbi:MAG: succinate dehydrogenase, cytochrome b556 subunit [Anaerolineae bacterium]|jgi:succinate dehydrogenase / fumarate reductase cytochrome b subunit
MAAIASIFRAVTYRGREGQIAWMLHRITGVGVFLFLAMHIFNIFLMSFPAHVFNSVLFFYHSVLFKLLSIFGLYLGVLYHALNGIRVMIVDFWPGAGKYQAPLWRIQMVIFVLVFIPSAVIMLERMF